MGAKNCPVGRNGLSAEKVYIVSVPKCSQPIIAQGATNKNPQYNFKSTSNRWVCKNGLSCAHCCERQGLMG